MTASNPMTIKNKKTILIENLPFETEKMIGKRARIGLVVLATDYTIEHEFRKLVTLPGVDFYHARISNSTEINAKTLAAMKPLIKKTADLLLPGDDLEVIAYGCTSASIVLGDTLVASLLNASKPNAKTTNPAQAASVSLKTLKAKRVGILTPYEKGVNKLVQKSMEDRGFEIPVFGSFNENHDPTVASINKDSLIRAIRKMLSSAKVDAIFISCTSVKIADSITEIENEIGVPVTSSNHALAWHCLRLAGINDLIPESGKLFQTTL